MNTELSRRDLLILIKETRPHYSVFEDIKHLGYRVGDSWIWNDYALDELSDRDLFKLYEYCSNSWKGAWR